LLPAPCGKPVAFGVAEHDDVGHVLTPIHRRAEPGKIPPAGSPGHTPGWPLMAPPRIERGTDESMAVKANPRVLSMPASCCDLLLAVPVTLSRRSFTGAYAPPLRLPFRYGANVGLAPTREHCLCPVDRRVSAQFLGALWRPSIVRCDALDPWACYG
jgi:hypothetical protein